MGANIRVEKAAMARALFFTYTDIFFVYLLNMIVASQAFQGQALFLPLAVATLLMLLAIPVVTRERIRSVGYANIVSAGFLIALLSLSPPPSSSYLISVGFAVLAAYMGYLLVRGSVEDKRSIAGPLCASSFFPALAFSLGDGRLRLWVLLNAVASLALLGITVLSFLWSTREEAARHLALSFALASFLSAVNSYAPPFSNNALMYMVFNALLATDVVAPPLIGRRFS